MERWVGTNAIVTGASSGIGASIAQKFVEAGINVIGIGRRIELLEDLAQRISNDKAKMYPIQCDIIEEKQILDVFDWIESSVGPISILVNNAGILNGSTDISDGDFDIWKQTIDINCIALCIFSRETIKLMKKHNIDGLVMHISSISARYVPDLPTAQYLANVYPATKHAVRALTESLSQELMRENSKIRVTSIAPGITYTQILRNHSEDDTAAFATMPYMSPDNVADAAMYILSTPQHVQVQELIIRPVAEFI